MLDVIFTDVAQPDQTRIVAMNAHTFLQNGGQCVISIKANCIDSTASTEAVFAPEVMKSQQETMKPQEQLTLEPYEGDHAVVAGVCRPPPKAENCTSADWIEDMCVATLTRVAFDIFAGRLFCFCFSIKRLISHKRKKRKENSE